MAARAGGPAGSREGNEKHGGQPGDKRRSWAPLGQLDCCSLGQLDCRSLGQLGYIMDIKNQRSWMYNRLAQGRKTLTDEFINEVWKIDCCVGIIFLIEKKDTSGVELADRRRLETETKGRRSSQAILEEGEKKWNKLAGFSKKTRRTQPNSSKPSSQKSKPKAARPKPRVGRLKLRTTRAKPRATSSPNKFSPALPTSRFLADKTPETTIPRNMYRFPMYLYAGVSGATNAGELRRFIFGASSDGLSAGITGVNIRRYGNSGGFNAEISKAERRNYHILFVRLCAGKYTGNISDVAMSFLWYGGVKILYKWTIGIFSIFLARLHSLLTLKVRPPLFLGRLCCQVTFQDDDASCLEVDKPAFKLTPTPVWIATSLVLMIPPPWSFTMMLQAKHESAFIEALGSFREVLENSLFLVALNQNSYLSLSSSRTRRKGRSGLSRMSLELEPTSWYEEEDLLLLLVQFTFVMGPCQN
ncbi:hypothetical protein M5K25_007633 [Dendrobium thyrsiflorum]|uniref:Uncharacterized protein n=1 Tax=Dendrobium thyrsiflorum TaxID=117978 RepID=A0ABD0VLU2_DENTH